MEGMARDERFIGLATALLGFFVLPHYDEGMTGTGVQDLKVFGPSGFWRLFFRTGEG